MKRYIYIYIIKYTHTHTHIYICMYKCHPFFKNVAIWKYIWNICIFSFSRQKVPILFDEEKKRYIYLIHVFILQRFWKSVPCTFIFICFQELRGDAHQDILHADLYVSWTSSNNFRFRCLRRKKKKQFLIRFTVVYMLSLTLRNRLQLGIFWREILLLLF